MARYPNGQPVRIPVTVRDVNGNLADAGAVTVVVQKPDATQTSYTAAHDSTGQYHQDLPAAPDLAQNGHYLWTATATAPNAGVARGDFDVFDPWEPAVLPLQDAKDAVNIPAATTTYDNELQIYVDTITGMIEHLTGGPAATRTITGERCEMRNWTQLTLRKRPVVTVTSITDEWSGASVSTADIVVDTNTGIVTRKGNLPFWFRGPWCLVTYTAGWGTSVPPAFNVAARIILTHIWETTRGPGMAPVPGLEETLLPGYSFAIPNRALEVLAPYRLEVYV